MPRPQFSIRTLLWLTLLGAMFIVAFHAMDICPHHGKESSSGEEFYFFWIGEPRDDCSAIFVEHPSSDGFLIRWPIYVGKVDLAWIVSEEEHKLAGP